MDLRTYAEQHGGTGRRSCPVLARVAGDAGCSAGTLYMVATGHKQLGCKLARRVAEATGCEVTMNDLRPDVFDPPATRN